jgi:hypothetical protein
MDNIDMRMNRNIENAQLTISSIIADKQELSTEIKNTVNLPQVTIHDREYLENKTKTMITRCENMLDQLEESFRPSVDDDGKIKINFSLYGVDVYAKVVNAVAVQVRELRELNRMVMGIDVINAEGMLKQFEDKQEKQSKTIKMSSSDLLKLIKEAGESNQLNAVDAEFKVINQKEPVNEPA